MCYKRYFCFKKMLKEFHFQRFCFRVPTTVLLFSSFTRIPLFSTLLLNFDQHTSFSLLPGQSLVHQRNFPFCLSNLNLTPDSIFLAIYPYLKYVFSYDLAFCFDGFINFVFDKLSELQIWHALKPLFVHTKERNFFRISSFSWLFYRFHWLAENEN